MTSGSQALHRAGPAPRRLGWRAQRSLLVGFVFVTDVLALCASFGLAYFLRFRAAIPWLEELPPRDQFYASVVVWAVPVWLLIFNVNHLYDRRHLFAGFLEYTRVVNACTAGTVAVILISFFDADLIISRGWLLLIWLLSLQIVCASRFGVRRLVRMLRRRSHLTDGTVIAGVNDEGIAIAEQLLADPACGLRVMGFIGSADGAAGRLPGGLQIVGDLGSVREVIQQYGISEIVVATTALGRGELLDLYRTFGHDNEVQLRMSSGLFEILTTGVTVQEISYVPLITPERVRITGLDAAIKSMLDYGVALLGLVLLSPLLVALAILIKLDSPGPVLHRRRVLGRLGRPFNAFKFRTMYVDADTLLDRDAQLRATLAKEHKLRHDPRVTRIGRFLRRSSLDELPQLLNVLRGEMSLIGPRMISPEEVSQYGKWQLNLLTVKPGITGPWQVRGRSDLPYQERVLLSMQYIRNYTIWLDLQILIRTIPAVLTARGAY